MEESDVFHFFTRIERTFSIKLNDNNYILCDLNWPKCRKRRNGKSSSGTHTRCVRNVLL